MMAAVDADSEPAADDAVDDAVDDVVEGVDSKAAVAGCVACIDAIDACSFCSCSSRRYAPTRSHVSYSTNSPIPVKVFITHISW